MNLFRLFRANTALLIIPTLLLLSCSKTPVPPVPTASFTATVGTNGDVSFTNTSQNATSYQWEFGDGDKATDTSPRHTYTANGKYTVVLTVKAEGGTATASNTVEVSSIPPPKAQFTFEYLSSGEVRFTNASQNATTYLWDFGDNSVKVTDVSPSHVYAANGKYNVVLAVLGKGGTQSSTQTVSVTNAPDPKPTADFTYTETAGVVSFQSNVTNATTLEWNFGDGTPNSAELNPKHTYLKNQVYTTSLKATGKGGVVTLAKSVEVKNAPLVDPKTIYISKITVTQLGYYPKIEGVFRVFIIRKDNAGFVDLFKSVDSYPLFQLDQLYAYTGGLPFKLNFVDRIHGIKLANTGSGYTSSFGDILESVAYFDTDQPVLTWLRSKGFPAKITIRDSAGFGYLATFDVEFKYDY